MREETMDAQCDPRFKMAQEKTTTPNSWVADL